MTTAVSIKEFRARTDEILDTVVEGQETVIVTLSDGRKFALVPGDEYESLDETSYLTSTEANRKSLAHGVRDANDGKTVKVDL
jgi:prevent-host-death family protein